MSESQEIISYSGIHGFPSRAEVRTGLGPEWENFEFHGSFSNEERAILWKNLEEELGKAGPLDNPKRLQKALRKLEKIDAGTLQVKLVLFGTFTLLTPPFTYLLLRPNLAFMAPFAPVAFSIIAVLGFFIMESLSMHEFVKLLFGVINKQFYQTDNSSTPPFEKWASETVQRLVGQSFEDGTLHRAEVRVKEVDFKDILTLNGLTPQALEGRIQFLDFGTGKGTFLNRFSRQLTGFGFSRVTGVGIEKERNQTLAGGVRIFKGERSLSRPGNYIHFADVTRLKEKTPLLPEGAFDLVTILAPPGVEDPEFQFDLWLDRAKYYVKENGRILIRLIHIPESREDLGYLYYLQRENRLLAERLQQDPGLELIPLLPGGDEEEEIVVRNFPQGEYEPGPLYVARKKSAQPSPPRAEVRAEELPYIRPILLKREIPEIQKMSPDWDEKTYRDVLNTGSTFAMVADAGKELAGFMIVRVTGHSLELIKIGVADHFRSRGIRAALVKKLKSKLFSHRRLVLKTFIPADDTESKSFYENEGFNATRLRAFFGPGKDAYRMTYYQLNVSDEFEKDEQAIDQMIEKINPLLKASVGHPALFDLWNDLYGLVLSVPGGLTAFFNLHNLPPKERGQSLRKLTTVLNGLPSGLRRAVEDVLFEMVERPAPLAVFQAVLPLKERQVLKAGGEEILLFGTRARLVPYRLTDPWEGIRPEAKVLALFLSDEERAYLKSQKLGVSKGNVLDALAFIRFYEEGKTLVTADNQSNFYRHFRKNEAVKERYRDWRKLTRLFLEVYARANGFERIVSPTAHNMKLRWPEIHRDFSNLIYNAGMEKLGYRLQNLPEEVEWEAGIPLKKAWVKHLKPFWEDPLFRQFQALLRYHPRAEVRVEGVQPLVNGERADSDTKVFDDRKGRSLEDFRMGLKEQFKPFMDQVQTRVSHSEKDDAGSVDVSQRQDGRDIQIHGEKHSAFLARRLQNFFIRSSRQPPLPGMDDVKAAFLKPSRGALRERHVEEKFHSNGLSRDGEGFFSGQPSAVFQSGLEVLGSQIGVILQNGLGLFSGSQELKEQMDRKPEAANASLTVQDFRIYRDSIKFSHGNPKSTTALLSGQFNPFKSRAEVREEGEANARVSFGGPLGKRTQIKLGGQRRLSEETEVPHKHYPFSPSLQGGSPGQASQANKNNSRKASPDTIFTQRGVVGASQWVSSVEGTNKQVMLKRALETAFLRYGLKGSNMPETLSRPSVPVNKKNKYFISHTATHRILRPRAEVRSGRSRYQKKIDLDPFQQAVPLFQGEIEKLQKALESFGPNLVVIAADEELRKLYKQTTGIEIDWFGIYERIDHLSEYQREKFPRKRTLMDPYHGSLHLEMLHLYKHYSGRQNFVQMLNGYSAADPNKDVIEAFKEDLARKKDEFEERQQTLDNKLQELTRQILSAKGKKKNQGSLNQKIGALRKKRSDLMKEREQFNEEIKIQEGGALLKDDATFIKFLVQFSSELPKFSGRNSDDVAGLMARLGFPMDPYLAKRWIDRFPKNPRAEVRAIGKGRGEKEEGEPRMIVWGQRKGEEGYEQWLGSFKLSSYDRGLSWHETHPKILIKTRLDSTGRLSILGQHNLASFGRKHPGEPLQVFLEWSSLSQRYVVTAVELERAEGMTPFKTVWVPDEEGRYRDLLKSFYRHSPSDDGYSWHETHPKILIKTWLDSNGILSILGQNYLAHFHKHPGEPLQVFLEWSEVSQAYQAHRAVLGRGGPRFFTLIEASEKIPPAPPSGFPSLGVKQTFYGGPKARSYLHRSRVSEGDRVWFPWNRLPDSRHFFDPFDQRLYQFEGVPPEEAPYGVYDWKEGGPELLGMWHQGNFIKKKRLSSHALKLSKDLPPDLIPRLQEEASTRWSQDEDLQQTALLHALQEIAQGNRDFDSLVEMMEKAARAYASEARRQPRTVDWIDEVPKPASPAENRSELRRAEVRSKPLDDPVLKELFQEYNLDLSSEENQTLLKFIKPLSYSNPTYIRWILGSRRTVEDKVSLLQFLTGKKDSQGQPLFNGYQIALMIKSPYKEQTLLTELEKLLQLKGPNGEMLLTPYAIAWILLRRSAVPIRFLERGFRSLIFRVPISQTVFEEDERGRIKVTEIVGVEREISPEQALSLKELEEAVMTYIETLPDSQKRMGLSLLESLYGLSEDSSEANRARLIHEIAGDYSISAGEVENILDGLRNYLVSQGWTAQGPRAEVRSEEEENKGEISGRAFSGGRLDKELLLRPTNRLLPSMQIQSSSPPGRFFGQIKMATRYSSTSPEEAASFTKSGSPEIQNVTRQAPKRISPQRKSEDENLSRGYGSNIEGERLPNPHFPVNNKINILNAKNTYRIMSRAEPASPAENRSELRRAEVRTAVSLDPTLERKESFINGPRKREIDRWISVIKRLVPIIERRLGFAPLDLSGWGIPTAEAAEVVRAGAILQSSYGTSVEQTGIPVIQSRLGLPRLGAAEKAAFVYLAGTIENGFFAAAPVMLDSYKDASAGVVRPEAYGSAVEDVKNRLKGRRLVEGEELDEVLGEIALRKPGRIFVFKKPDEYLPASLIRKFAERGLKLEVRSVSPLDLERFKSSDPKLGEQIEALVRAAAKLRVAA